MTSSAFQTTGSRVEPGEIDLAVTMRLEALKINQALGSRLGIANDFGRLATLYILQGNLDQAENYGNLANLYWSQGLLQEAGACYNQALSLFEETGNRVKTRKVLELLDSLKTTQP